MSLAESIFLDRVPFTLSYDYIIYQDGNLYFAFNTKTKQIEFVGTDAGKVINQALNNLTPNRTWKEKVMLKGNLPLSSGIIIPDYTILDFRLATLLMNGNFTVITNNNRQGNSHIEVLGGVINAQGYNAGGTNAGDSLVYLSPVSYSKVKGILFENLGSGANCLSIGTEVINNVVYSSMYDRIEDLVMIGPYGGMILTGVGHFVKNIRTIGVEDTAIALNGTTTPFGGHVISDCYLDGAGIDCYASSTINDSQFYYSLIENTIINAYKVSGSVGDIGLHLHNYFRRLILNNVEIKNCAGEGILIEGVSGTPTELLLDNVIIHDNQYAGIAGWNIRNLRLNNVKIYNNAKSGYSIFYITGGYNYGNPAGIYLWTGLGPSDTIELFNVDSFDNQATATQLYSFIHENNTDKNLKWIGGYINKPVTFYIASWLLLKHIIGYDTANFKVTGLSVPVGVSGAYGSAVSITSLSGVITLPRVKITWGGTFGTGETVTVQITAVYSDGTTASITKSATAVGSLWLTDDDVFALIIQGKDITQLQVSASSNLASTSVTVTVNAYGKA